MKKTFKTIINIALGFGTLLVFNESTSITPNFIGIACFALLIVVNCDKEVIERLQK